MAPELREDRLKGPESCEKRRFQSKEPIGTQSDSLFPNVRLPRRVAWTRNQGNLPRPALQRQDRGDLVFVLVQFLHGSEGPAQPSCRASTCVQWENFSPLSNPTQIKFHEMLTGSSEGCSESRSSFCCSVVRCALCSLPTSIACLPRSSGKCIAGTKHSPG